MALSGGKVGKVPHVDQGKSPQKIEFTPEEKKKIAEREVKLLEFYPKAAEEFKKRFPQLAEALSPKSLEDYVKGIKQPTTAGPKKVQTYDVKFRVELLDKKGHIVGYHEIKPHYPVTSCREEAPDGRRGRSYDGYEDIAHMTMGELSGTTEYQMRFSIELDHRDLANLDATSSQLEAAHKGHKARIIMIGGPVEK